MMLAVLGRNHASSPAQTGELGHTIVPILKMWQFTAALLIPVIAYFERDSTVGTLYKSLEILADLSCFSNFVKCSLII